MNASTPEKTAPAVERQRMDVDIVCVGLGPATGGFLTTLSRQLMKTDGTPRFESVTAPGMPLQVLCYERADDMGFGVSGVVTRARAVRASFSDLDPAQVPLMAPVAEERLLYLLDPLGASRRSLPFRAADALIRAFGWMLPYRDHAFRMPYIPPFLNKHDGLVLSMGQFMQWVGGQIMSTGAVQIWPGTPVAEALIENQKVQGVRLVDQGTDRKGKPEATFMPGMDIHAALTVVGDGPVGPLGRQLDEQFGMPGNHHVRDWAVSMKMVVNLRDDVDLKPGTVFHTFGYPEPEIFGFMYVYPDKVASMGVFVPAWYPNPVRTTYRYLQHWMMHPYLWQYLKGGTLRSWGAKTLQESGRRGEPYLVGDGYARIGEGSGTTNVLTNSGVDEAWATGVQLAEGVIELLDQKKPFTKENLEQAYVKRRRASWVEKEARVAEKARDGFNHGVIAGLIGTGLTGMTGGLLNMPGKSVPPHRHLKKLEEYYEGRISADELAKIRKDCEARSVPLHDVIMDRCGWPSIPYDGKLLVTHQDALLVGGKVQAPSGYADHVAFVYPHLCESCDTRVCIELCSAQAIAPGKNGGIPEFDREKCVHCGACVWNCSRASEKDPERGNMEFCSGAGGLHSAEN
jgi:electron-transferring-flavoprotein dehydrogenase